MNWTGNISFFGTNNLEKTDKFYKKFFDLEVYKDQGKCKIYNIPGAAGRIAFCEHMEVLTNNNSPIITFLTEEVDETYEKFKDMDGIKIESKPVKNNDFNIYQFFARDPNGYTLEIQKFLD